MTLSRTVGITSRAPTKRRGDVNARWQTRLVVARRIWVAGIDAVEKDIVVEGMNEKGLAVGLSYQPGLSTIPAFNVG